MSKANIAEALENVLDGLTCQITEQGWEELDRYYKRPFKMYVDLMMLLEIIHEEKGQKIKDLAIKLELIEEDKVHIYKCENTSYSSLEEKNSALEE